MKQCAASWLCVLKIACLAALIAGLFGPEWKVTEDNNVRDTVGLWRSCFYVRLNGSETCQWTVEDFNSQPVYQQACQILMSSSVLFSLLALLIFSCLMCRDSADIAASCLVFNALAGVFGIAGVVWYAVDGLNLPADSPPSLVLRPGWSYIASVCASAMLVITSALVGTLHGYNKHIKRARPS